MHNAAFFDYLETLIKQDKLSFAFKQIEYFLDEAERRNLGDLRATRTTYAMLENRFNRWREQQIRKTNSGNDENEINQIVAGMLSGMETLQQVPNFDYADYQYIVEPEKFTVPINSESKKIKWYWWVILVSVVFSAAGVGYLLFKKDNTNTQFPVEPKVEKKKSLLIILHELGDRSIRSIKNQGRIVIRDTAQRIVTRDIGNDGVVFFRELEDWVFNAKPFLMVELKGVDEREYKYRLLDSLCNFQRGDTTYLVFDKIEIAKPQPEDPKPSNDINLYFYYAKTGIKKTFAFAKNNTISSLKKHIIANFINKDELRMGTGTVLYLPEKGKALMEENLTLVQAKLENRDVIGLNIIMPAVMRINENGSNTNEQLLKVRGDLAVKKPMIKINNTPVQAEKNGNTYTIKVPSEIKTEQIQISIQDGDTFYNYEIAKTLVAKGTIIDVKQMRKASIKSVIQTDRIKQKQLNRQ